MKQNGLDTYESDAKKQSRRIIAEELFRRIKDPTNATVLYLPGPHDYQRKSLLNIGFRNENIFGVDLGANVQAVRDRGGYCIEGKLHEVIEAWPVHRSIEVVLADMCSGMDKSALNVAWSIGSLVRKQKSSPVVYLNMQRGRDAFGNQIREAVTKQLWPIKNTPHTHRGLLLLTHLVNGLTQSYHQAKAIKSTPQDFFQAVFRDMRCRYDSYKNTSSSVVMDGVILNWHEFLKIDAAEINPKVKQRIAATLATATRRRNERLAA
jgi:hypothetical protein